MRGLPDADRRGRPDIVHFCLLLALDTPLNQEGLLRTYVHTRHDKLITVDPSSRPPRMFNRFEGLLEHLFLKGEAPPEKPLLRLEDASIAELIERIRPKRVITFSEQGKPKLCREIFGGISREDDVCAIVGAFPRGEYSSNVAGLPDEPVSLDPEPLRAPTVVARAIYAYEEATGIQELRQKS